MTTRLKEKIIFNIIYSLFGLGCSIYFIIKHNFENIFFSSLVILIGLISIISAIKEEKKKAHMWEMFKVCYTERNEKDGNQ